MDRVTLQLVTIIAEGLLEERLVHELRQLGALGYTLTRVHGEGSRGVRGSDWEGGNVKIETIVSAAVAERLLAHVAERYFPWYAVITYVQPVDVIRGDKYVAD